ncbi:type II toxin-antitoxin system MqsA family antitoxin [Lysobacter sp. A3-1-A15]|uniref:type II toxin-antitoxin system MqsA family antitoxin n=1 Tax=Novilysobacter viscosus TaxID=3098602 RepID=UPI002EDAE8D4
MSSICPICEKGSLQLSTATEEMRYGEATLKLEGYAFSVCSGCGAESVSPEQARSNELLMADAKRQHDGLLVSSQIREWRRALNLTQAQASELLGGGANAFSKYERGQVIQSRAMDLLMRLAWHSHEARSLLKDRSRLTCGATFVDEQASSWTKAKSPVRPVDIIARMVNEKSHELMAANEELRTWHPARCAHA